LTPFIAIHPSLVFNNCAKIEERKSAISPRRSSFHRGIHKTVAMQNTVIFKAVFEKAVRNAATYLPGERHATMRVTVPSRSTLRVSGQKGSKVR
jgi:hypothetical protein